MGRQRLWVPLALESLRPGYETRLTDGKIRNGSRNLLTEFFNGDELCVKVETSIGSRIIAAVKELVAMAVHGKAPRFRCRVCGELTWIRHHVVHLNGDPVDCSPGNLKYVPDSISERAHEIQCLEILMRQPPVPLNVSYREGEVHKILFS